MKSMSEILSSLRTRVWLISAVVLFDVTIGSVLAGQDGCDRQPQMETWLYAQIAKWEKVLLLKTGYEQPENVIVCRVTSGRSRRVTSGRSRSDYVYNRIYLRFVEPEEDQLSLAHEYLHLAFQHHPRAADERFIEQTARELIFPERRSYEANE